MLNKRTKIFSQENLTLAIIAIIILVISYQSQSYALSTVVNIPQSTSQTNTKTYTLPVGATAQSVTADNGSATYTQSGTTVTINATGGTGFKLTTTGTDSQTKSTNSFPATISYNDGSYSGTLSKNGSSTSTVISGSYTAASSITGTDSRTNSTNSFPSTVSYNSGGYTGTIYKSGSSYVSSGSAADSKYQRYNPSYYSYTITDYCVWNAYTGYMNYSYSTFSPQQPASSYWYNDGTYSGMLALTKWENSVTYTSHATPPYNYSFSPGAHVNGQTYVTAYHYWNAYFDGTVSKPDTRQYTQNYSGTVTKPATDTRVYSYTQSYIGTVYSIANYYAYNVTLNYVVDTIAPSQPTIAFSSPVGYTSGTWARQNVIFTLTSGTDTGGSGVNKTEYSTDGGTSWTTYESAVTISIEGTTSLLARTVDNAGNRSTNTTATIKIDKTAPINASVIINSNASETTSITVSLALSATDALSGLGNMMISNYSNFTTNGNTANPVVAIPYAISKSWTTTTGGGQKYVYIKFFDTAGNTSTTNANILYIVRPTITSITISGPRYYEEDMPISATGTNATQAGYRIYYTTDVTAPPVDYTVNAATPGAGWTDSAVAGTITVNSSINVSGIVLGENLSNKTWTYITLKIAIGSVTDTWVWKYSQAYSLNSNATGGPDTYIGYVGHNQIINIGSNKIVLTDPNTPNLDYGPYDAADVSKISSFNIFINEDYVTYRLEFDAISPSKINDLKINLYFVGGIDVNIDKMDLKKQQADGTFTVIKDLSSSYTKRGVGRYSVLLGNDTYNQPIISQNGVARYALEYSGKLKIATFLGSSVKEVESFATIGVYTSGYTYPYTLQLDKPGRKFYIDTNVWGTNVQYR